MNSKEALERILMLARPCAYEVREHRNNYCDMLENAIKQDLDRLEQLEKENQRLKKVRDNYSDQLNYVWNIVNSLKDENTKPKQAIKILKDKIEFEDLGEMQGGNVYRGYFNDCLDEEQYELLKQVFESVGDGDE